MNRKLEQRKRISVIRTIAIKDKNILFEDRKIDNPSKAAKLANILLANADRENTLVCCLDTKCQPLSIETIGIGTVNSCLIVARDVFKNAILSNAAFIILFHNHPSGISQASNEDRLITKRLIDAGNILGIPILDHIILGDEKSYTSLREEMNWSIKDSNYYKTY